MNCKEYEEEKVEILRDMQGFIEFCIREGWSLPSAFGNLIYDIRGIFDEVIDGTDGFLPRTTGYAKHLPTPDSA